MTSLFQPYRAQGYITDAVPFFVQRRGRDTFFIVSVGKAWQIYNCAKLTLSLVGPQLPKRVVSVVAEGDFTFAACGREITVCRRVHQVATWRGHSEKILQLLVLGSHLLSLGSDRKLILWDAQPASINKWSRINKGASQGVGPKPEGDGVEAVEGGEWKDGASPLVATIELGEEFTPTCFCHPDTYINKVLVGSQEGTLQIWNVATRKCVYTFKGWGAAVTCLEASPALDTVAVGLADGRVIVHNLRFDEEVVQFRHAKSGPVTSVSFRTDGQPIMATGGRSGMVNLWDLAAQKLAAVIKDAHGAAVVRLHFLRQEPILVTSGADNSIKMFIFDSSDGEARLLRFRSGHHAPPTRVRYYGSSGRLLLSAGRDRAFRVFAVGADQQSRELSQGKGLGGRAKRLKVAEEELKLPRVLEIAAADLKERDWSNVVTCHADCTSAYTWRLLHFAKGEHVLTPPANTPPTPVTAVAVSACGNFAVIGTAGGRIDRFTMQSGIHRGTYTNPPEVAAASGIPRLLAHAGLVTGVECEGANRLMVSGSLDRSIKIWDFKKGGLLRTIAAPSPVVRLALHNSSGLLATASDDHVIRVYDADATRGALVRTLRGHTDRVTDICISRDARWVLSSAMDGSLRVWDVVAARCVDAMVLPSPVTSLSLSPAMDLLATTHADQNGIYLWANQLMYSSESYERLVEGAYASSQQAPHEVALPTVSTGNAAGAEEGEEEALEGKGGADQSKARGRRADANGSAAGAGDGSGSTTGGRSAFPEQLMPELVTLSLVPHSHWQSMVHLDVIKARNKPIEPPKKPEAAPFFLPTLPTLSGEPVFAVPTPEEGKGSAGDWQQAPGGTPAAPALAALRGWGDGSGEGEDKWADSDEEEEEEEEERAEGKQGKGRRGGEGHSGADDSVDTDEQGEEGKGRGGKGQGGKGKGKKVAGGGNAPTRPHASHFERLLETCARSGNYDPFVALLRNMSASAIELELRLMELIMPDDDDSNNNNNKPTDNGNRSGMAETGGKGGKPGGKQGGKTVDKGAADQGERPLPSVPDEARPLLWLLRFLLDETQRARNYELVQAVMHLTLKIHGETVTRFKELKDIVQELNKVQSKTWTHLDTMFQHARCMVALFSNTQ